MKQTYEQAVAGGHVGRARKRLTKILQEQQQLALMEGVPPEPQPEAQAAGGEGLLSVIAAKRWALAREVLEQLRPQTNPRTTCAVCCAEFPSRTQLFKHLKGDRSQQGASRGCVPAGSSSGARRLDSE